jgi:regulatory protein
MTGDKPACRRRAMDLLARREHSRRELVAKLSARSFAPELIGEVLDELEREGLLSAERFALSFVEARYGKGKGPRRIRAELAERGIESADDYLVDGRFDWGRLARETRIKRFGAAPPKDLKDKARQVRFLEYRGFGHDEIRRALEFEEDSD